VATTITASFLKPRRTPASFYRGDRDHDGLRDANPVKVRTWFGWTPGVRSLIAGRVLRCGCLVGVYDTQTGAIVEILDARGLGCPHAAHARDAVLHPERLSLG
jgi:hypothetical protein